MDVLFTAFLEIMQPATFALMALGVFGGLVVGAIPGFSATMAIVIILPLTFTLSAMQGLAVMIGVAIGGMSGGLVSAMLIGIPGTPGSVATTFDGLPLARKGEQGKALGLGIWSSCIGGVLSGLALIVLAPYLGRIGLEIGPWGYFAMVVFALTITASLSEGMLLKGLIAAAAGLLAASVGEEQMNGVTRLTFGNSAIDAGFDFLPIMIGVFAFSQLLSDMPDTATARHTLAGDLPKATQRIQHLWAIRELIVRWVTVVRSTAIGLIVGVIPATGASISNIVAYDQAKRNSKEADQFGKGAYDGIIAPEAANNATQGGALLMLMALGIPGDAVAAVLLAALVIHNVIPGPSFITDEPSLAYGIFVAFILAHLLMVVFQMLSLKLFLRVVRLPIYIMAASVLFYCALGAYTVNNSMYDVWVMIAFGGVGFLMTRFGYPIAPFVLGVVLGGIAEVNLIRALSISSDYMQFLTRPWSLLFIGLTLMSVLLAIVARHRISARALTLVQLPILMVICAALAQMPGIVRPALAVGILGLALLKIYFAFADKSRRAIE
ncbi:tripartite tricarboxylate transporter permease [Pararhodobacter oceanensis]|uniref:tripartite tricarboxylate transporter permease n=1 Tax=Pararhodobacter oceanensis TaxID=2172121 RepID=UPI003A9391B5